MNFRKLQKSIIKKYKYLRCFMYKGEKILVLSDSHGGVFEYIFDNNLFVPHLINVEIVGGATAYGLLKKHSETNSFNKYKTGLQRFKTYNTILIQLGEVDCSFVLWKKAEKEKSTSQETIQCSIVGYEKLIKTLVKLKKTIIISGAILPTLKDGQRADETAQLRNTIFATQQERTNLILHFNLELKKLAEKYNLSYIDITNETIDKSTQMINAKYIRKDKIDHHQSFQETAPIWVKKLREVIK